MGYREELLAQSSAFRAWEAEHEKELGELSLAGLAANERRHNGTMRALRVVMDDGNKRLPKRPAAE
jgi:hypothetical protein